MARGGRASPGGGGTARRRAWGGTEACRVRVSERRDWGGLWGALKARAGGAENQYGQKRRCDRRKSQREQVTVKALVSCLLSLFSLQ